MTKLNRNLKASNLLKQALALLGPRGEYWIKFNFRTPNGKFCPIGALMEISPNAHYTAQTYLEKAVAIKTNFCSIIRANDHHSTKFSQVESWFKYAIKLAKSDRN
jgi:hypothetical protein